MTDIQNPGAVKPEALTDERILEVATKEFPRWREDIQPRFVLRVVRAALELQPEPALTDERITDIADSDECNPDRGGWGSKFDYLLFARAIERALGRGVPSSLLEKSEGSFHPGSTR